MADHRFFGKILTKHKSKIIEVNIIPLKLIIIKNK